MTARTTRPPPWLTDLLTHLAEWAARLGARDHAADLAQETALRLLARYGHDELAAQPTALVRAIARRALRNLVIDESRRWRPPIGRGEPACPEALADMALEARRALARLDMALATLDVPERDFVLAAMRMDSVLAAQKAVGWPRRSPYYQLGLLLDRLRSAMEARPRAH